MLLSLFLINLLKDLLFIISRFVQNMYNTVLYMGILHGKTTSTRSNTRDNYVLFSLLTGFTFTANVKKTKSLSQFLYFFPSLVIIYDFQLV